jgi:hypothetical protein
MTSDRPKPHDQMDHRQQLGAHFEESSLSVGDRLRAFPRYVQRQEQARYLFRWELFKRVHDVHGSIVELGVHLGAGIFSFAAFAEISEPYNFQRRVIGFDTFEGFPSISDKDQTTATAPATRKAGGFYVNDDHFDQLQQSVELFDDNRLLNHVPRIELVKGDALETIPSYLEKNPHLVISLLYLDFDLYEPTLKALQLLYDRVVVGGVIALDEVNDPRWPGETAAFLEFFGGKTGRLERMPFEPNASFFIKQSA